MSFPLKFDKLSLTKCAAESMVYLERHKLLEILTQLFAEISIERPENVRVWISKNIVRIADCIYKNCLKISYEGGGECKFFQLPRRFHHRVVIFGRRGSGRKTQATSLAKQFNLIYIDAEQLLQRNLQGTEKLAKELQDAFACENMAAKSQTLSEIISQRFLQPDCLQKGWVLVNYPTNLEECKELFEKFTIPPNKFVYLKCPVQLALQRAVLRPELSCPQNSTAYIEKELEHFDLHEAEVNAYLKQRHEVIEVDAVEGSELVRTAMLAKLEKVPYVMGFKQM